MMMQRFWGGFSFLKRGFAEIKSDKKMKLLVIIPLIIDIAIFIAAISFTLPLVPELIAVALGYLFSSSEGFLYNLVYYPLWLLFGIVFLVAVSAATYFVASVLASPFNALLAERVAEKAGVIPERPFQMGFFIKNSIKMLLVSLMRTTALVCIGLFLFILSFLPGVNLATSFIAFMLIAFDASDYAMETLEYPLSKRFKFFRESFAEYAGMGAAVGLVMLIPGFIILCMPLAVVGSSQIVTERKLL